MQRVFRNVAAVFPLACLVLPASLHAQDAMHYWSRGKTAFNARDYDTAITDYSEGLRLSPGNWVIREDRAKAWQEKGEYDKAIEDLTEVISQKTGIDAASSYTYRGDAWFTKGEVGRAMADFNEALRRRPEWYPAYTGRGNVWREKGEFDRAIEEYNQAVRFESKFAPAYNGRGIVWAKKRDYHRAIEDYGKAIHFNFEDRQSLSHIMIHDRISYYENRADAWKQAGQDNKATADLRVARGLGFLDKGERDSAAANLSEAIRLVPDESSYYRERQNIWTGDKAYADSCIAAGLDYLFVDGKVDEAIKEYNSALRFNPTFVEGYYQRGVAWAVKKEHDKAIADYNQALAIDPNRVAVYVARGDAWYRKGEYDKAVTDFNLALANDPNCAEAYYNRGGVWLDKGEYDKAVADYNLALANDPNCAGAYCNRGTAWEQKGEYDRAIADHNKALEIDPNEARFYRGRGTTWEKKGEYDKAIVDFNKGQQLAPNSAASYYNLAMLYAACPDENCRDGQKAVANATKAYQLLGEEHCGASATLAAAYAESGDFEKAKGWVAKAIELAASDETKQKLRACMELYKQGKPYRFNEPKKN